MWTRKISDHSGRIRTRKPEDFYSTVMIDNTGSGFALLVLNLYRTRLNCFAWLNLVADQSNKQPLSQAREPERFHELRVDREPRLSGFGKISGEKLNFYELTLFRFYLDFRFFGFSGLVSSDGCVVVVVVKSNEAIPEVGGPLLCTS